MLQGKISLIFLTSHFEINKKGFERRAEEERLIFVLFHFICHSDIIIVLQQAELLSF
jgi:hypothetical protein